MKSTVQATITRMMQEGKTRKELRLALEAQGFSVSNNKTQRGAIEMTVFTTAGKIGTWQI